MAMALSATKSVKSSAHSHGHKNDHEKQAGEYLRDIILGGQDGLVNVLGIVLAVAMATHDTRIVLVAGLAATFAESISMAAVAYTSSKAAFAYYLARLDRAEEEVEAHPADARKEIRALYRRKGFSGRFLNRIVERIVRSRKLTMQTLFEARKLSAGDYESPKKDAAIVGFSAVLGSFVPLAPFFFVDVLSAMIISVIVSSLALFITGVYKARITVGVWWRSGLEVFVVGMTAAIAGFLIGYFFGAM